MAHVRKLAGVAGGFGLLVLPAVGLIFVAEGQKAYDPQAYPSATVEPSPMAARSMSVPPTAFTPTPVPPEPTPVPTPEPTPVLEPAPPPPVATPEPVVEVFVPACAGVRYLSWVWQFPRDGSSQEIAPLLAEHKLGILLKTHDATDWMARYDTSPEAVSGPERVRALSDYFEAQGVPFHAWAVVKGLDPIGEAEMAAQVLASGARSIVLDLEPWEGFWQGPPEAALAFGRQLRRLQPDAVVITAVDPRPFALTKVPVAEFASFSNGFAPLTYWETFNSPSNVEKFTASGWPPPPQGITPEFLLDVTASLLGPYNLPLQPVAQGSSQDMNAWTRFLDHASRIGIADVSVWRHGVTDPQVWPLLKERTPAGLGYVVQPGDTLSALASRWGVTVESIVGANQIADPNFISVGQMLCKPSG